MDKVNKQQKKGQTSQKKNKQLVEKVQKIEQIEEKQVEIKKQDKKIKNKQKQYKQIIDENDKIEQEDEDQQNEQDFADLKQNDEILQEEDAIEKFLKLQMKQKAKQHEQKEKKIVDFKFRVLELIDIYLKKTEEPQTFLDSILQICESIKQSQSITSQQAFSYKLCNILKKFIERQPKLEQQEHQDQIKVILDNLTNFLAKSANKSVFKTLQTVFFYLCKQLVNNEEYLIELFKKIIQATIQKRNVQFNEGFFREMIKSQFEISIKLIPDLLQASNFQGEIDNSHKDSILRLFLEVSNYLIISGLQHKQELTKKAIKKNFKSILEIVEGGFKNHEQIKKKKISVLRKYSEILIKSSNFLPAEQKENLINNIKNSMENWTEIESIKTKENILKKISPQENKNSEAKQKEPINQNSENAIIQNKIKEIPKKSNSQIDSKQEKKQKNKQKKKDNKI